MYKEKFIINENGYYSGYSQNGTIPMTEEFNISNLPTPRHKYVDGVWILDEQKVKKEEFEQICTALDEVTEQLLHNDARYGNLAKYTESYLTRKEELVEKQAELVLVLETLLEEIEDDTAK